MDSYLRSLQELLNKFDKDLFCKRTGEGVVRVYHNKLVWRPYELDGDTYFFPNSEPYHVFSLTDTWGFNGNPAQHGALPIWNKLRSLEDPDRQMREVIQSEIQDDAIKDRHQKSFTEDMAYQMRDAVKEDTKDILVHSLNKKKDKRRIYDKKRSL